MSVRASAVVVGQANDPHVRAVLDRLHGEPLLMDAHSLSTSTYSLRQGRFRVSHDDRELELDVEHPVRGWARRLAPPDWQRGTVLESRAAATKASWLGLLTSVVRTCGTRWLTTIDAQIVGEGKVLQASVARSAGVPTAQLLVTNQVSELAEAFNDEVVLKPLGPGHYFEDDEPFVVFANRLPVRAPELSALAGAPFIAQKVMKAVSHLRVVTVDGEAWAASLSADHLPLDWRRDTAAHTSFVPASPPRSVTDGAIRIASALGLGYSSQDWVLTESGPVMLDVNPAGQWLFLPPEISDQVSDAIASWLERPLT